MSTQMYDKIYLCKHMSDAFCTQNGLRQDVLLPLIFNSALEFAISKEQENTSI
jgi:hypothetical protein